ncbi:N-acetyltransferase [Dysgonomonas capnocytophagoides]|uniref:N-acetyltransferase n=1 Tax=Dysgonomonas capnocytophagoides TaxID=45254 RepID=A0A4Y8LCS8_9BACT|nr:GNAT family N-acetyltransferase [Dysgonomonas capnocytophagoides]TFD98840.1 N-acetyltransferase [Dysgonomonas capnocytophagoides]
MYLENDDIKLRALEPEDLEVLYKWENDTQLWIHGNTLSPYSKLALREYIADTQQTDIYQAKQLRLMIELESDGTVIGTVDIYDFDFHHAKAGIGILVDNAYRQCNYATIALELVHEYIFNFLRINQLYAYIASDNKNSLKLFEKSGYKQSGFLKQWIYCSEQYKDVYIYQLVNNH